MPVTRTKSFVFASPRKRWLRSLPLHEAPVESEAKASTRTWALAAHLLLGCSEASELRTTARQKMLHVSPMVATSSGMVT